MSQIFISHTKKDKEFCDEFDIIIARAGIKAFRSEFEDIETPAWRTIKEEMNKSVALFFLVGKKLLASQSLRLPDWQYTQNWIAYEIGLACQKGIDVWAICESYYINFPMPYINNYILGGLKEQNVFKYLRSILEMYIKGGSFEFPYKVASQNFGVICPHLNCGAQFNLHKRKESTFGIKCPQCLKVIVFRKGFPYNPLEPPKFIKKPGF